jgi:sortase A
MADGMSHTEQPTGSAPTREDAAAQGPEAAATPEPEAPADPKGPPTLARVIRAAGRTLISIGALFILFAAYQVWGTSLQEARAQRSLKTEFAQLMSRVSTTVPATTSSSSTSSPNSSLAPSTEVTTTTAPTTTLPPETEEVLTRFRSGDAIAHIWAPKIGLDKIVVQGVEVDDLRRGPGHYKSTPMPGQKGNAAIAGHRTTYGAPFGDIDKLEPGDEIYVSTLQGEFTYRVLSQAAADGTVSGHFIVDPTDVWVLDDAGDSRLTLTACHPKFSASNRIVVQALLVEPPAPKPQPAPTTTIPESTSTTTTASSTTTTLKPAAIDDLNSGLGGDGSQRLATIMWGVAVAGLMIVIARYTPKWGRLRSWAVGSVPFVLLLFVFFEHLDRILPAR